MKYIGPTMAIKHSTASTFWSSAVDDDDHGLGWTSNRVIIDGAGDIDTWEQLMQVARARRQPPPAPPAKRQLPRITARTQRAPLGEE